MRFFEGVLRSHGLRLLVGTVKENGGAVLRTPIGTLAIYLRGIVILPEYFEQIGIMDLRRIEFDLDGLRVAMIHDSGPSAGRPARLRRRFPAADLVIFGHSHIPLDHAENGQRIFNPGSPTDRRRQPHGTLGLLDVAEGRLIQAQIVPVT